MEAPVKYSGIVETVERYHAPLREALDDRKVS